MSIDETDEYVISPHPTFKLLKKHQVLNHFLA